jgi:hypothetical protein
MVDDRLIEVDVFENFAKIEHPFVGTTGKLYSTFALGFYNPEINAGYLFHTFPIFCEVAPGPRELAFGLIDPNFKGDRSKYHVLLSGLRNLYLPSSHPFFDEEFRENARMIEEQIPELLEEMGFDLEKVKQRYNGQEGNHRRTAQIIIDTIDKLAEIQILNRNGMPTSTHHTIHGI